MTNEKPAAVSSAGGGGLSRSVLSRVWRFFNSLKLTLSILLGIAAVSIAGTVVEQGQPIETYITRYGERWGNLIINLQLNDMYHSPWFTVFLVLLVLNITVCTIERFPPKWKTLLKENKGFDPSIIERLANRDSFELSSPPAVVREKIIHRLKKKRYKIKVDDSSGGAYSVYAEKGIVGRFGSDVTHISLFLILTGTIIGSYWGFRDFSAIHLGSTVDVQGVDFKLRLDNFWIDFYDTGQIKQYNSVLTVVEGGKDVLKKQIWVNEPLFYKGIRFYQSSYGVAWDRVKDAEIALKRLSKNEVDQPVSVRWGEKKSIPGTDYRVRLVGYVSDFAFDPETKEVFSKSGETNNPAVRVEVYEGEKLVFIPWLFFNYPGLVQAIPNSGYDLVLTGFRTIPYSGISIGKDPGTNVVWAGTIVMGLGFILAFFVYHRRIWVAVYPVSGEDGSMTGGSLVKIGGMINKNPLGFEREFKDIIEALGGRSR